MGMSEFVLDRFLQRMPIIRPYPGLCGAGLQAGLLFFRTDIEHLEAYKERHGEVAVSFRDFMIGAFWQAGVDAVRNKEAQREHPDCRMLFDELAEILAAVGK